VAKWPLGRAALLFVAALIPFGPWLVDRRMKQYEGEYFQLRDGRSFGQNAGSGENLLDKSAPKV
jgi:hypothetical protein